MRLAAGLTRAEAVTKLLGEDVTPAMVSMWALRGWVDSTGKRRRLRVVGKAPNGDRLYHVRDLIEAEADTRTPTVPRPGPRRDRIATA